MVNKTQLKVHFAKDMGQTFSEHGLDKELFIFFIVAL